MSSANWSMHPPVHHSNMFAMQLDTGIGSVCKHRHAPNGTVCFQRWSAAHEWPTTLHLNHPSMTFPLFGHTAHPTYRWQWGCQDHTCSYSREMEKMCGCLKINWMKSSWRPHSATSHRLKQSITLTTNHLENCCPRVTLHVSSGLVP